MDDLQTMFPVDYVFPYVNPNDPNWLNEYNKYIDNNDAFKSMYQDWGLLKYKFRSLAKNMPWIRNIVFIVSSESQIPEWLNTDTVRVQLHNDYIPKNYLPTFNSCTIELFLPNDILLNHHIIYSNDDMFIMKPTSFDDFFTKDGLPKLSYEMSNYKDNFLNIPKRCTDYARKYLKLKEDDYFIVPQHYCTPMNIKNLQKFYWDIDFKKSITLKRDNSKNYSQYLYTIYQILSNQYQEIEPIGKVNNLMGIAKKEVFQDILNPTEKLLCINDYGVEDTELIENIQKTFEKVFPDKCKYEK